MAADITIKRGDLLPSLTVIARDAVGPVDLAGATAAFKMRSVLNGALAIENQASVAAGIPFTASGATLSATAHGLNNGESVTVKSTGALPSPLSTQKEYFVINAAADTLQLSQVPGGVAVTTTNAGSGVHALLSGRVTYQWEAGDTNSPGTFLAEVETIIAGKSLSYPNGRHFKVEIIADV